MAIFVHYVRSLSKHIDDVVNDNRWKSNDIIGFTETQINPSNSTRKITETVSSIWVSITVKINFQV